MSNHSGSRMLNRILKMLEQEAVFEHLGKDSSQIVVQKILSISNFYDCNSGEVLEEIGERLGICSCCYKVAEKFQDGLCQNCCGGDFISEE